MTILNLASDGLPPVLVTLALMVAREKEILRDNLIDICSPPGGTLKEKDGDTSSSARLRATLNRWIALGLFADAEGKIRLNVASVRTESTEEFALRLPEICRRILLESEQALPLWPVDGLVSEENTGRSADLCRGLAWCLAQDIYTFPSSTAEVDELVRSQVHVERFIFLNSTRWPGLCSWVRYLGFATGEDSGLLFDPTMAVRAHLTEVIQVKESLPAAEFVARLAARLPVLDQGLYRTEVEQALKSETWRPPASDHLSSSLSIALRRLQRQGTIALELMADAGSRLALTGQHGKTWEDFTHVRLLKGVE